MSSWNASAEFVREAIERQRDDASVVAAQHETRYDNVSTRDAIAGQVLAALIAHDGLSRPPEQCAALVYKYVDALSAKGKESAQ